MKKILPLLLLLVSLSLFSQKGNEFFKQFKVSNSSSINKTNNLLNLRDSSHMSHWYNNAWFFSNKEMYGYNSSEEEIKDVVLYISFGGSVWDTVSRTKNYLYDTNHNLLEKELEDENGSGWQNENKLIRTYDANNNILTSVTQEWLSAAWSNLNKETMTYDSNNNLLTYVYQQWNSVAWINAFRYTATYNLNNELTSLVTQSWNTSSGTWVNNSNWINVIYSGGDLVSYYTQVWNTSTSMYELSSRTTATFDANHHMLTQLHEDWVDFTNSWENTDNYTYTYDGNGNLTSDISQTWTMGSWVNGYKNEHYYPSSVGIREQAGKHETMLIYPNPATTSITISNTVAFAEVTIVDVSGKIAMSEKSSPLTQITMNIDSLQSGIYFVSLKGDNQTVYKKFVKK